MEIYVEEDYQGQRLKLYLLERGPSNDVFFTFEKNGDIRRTLVDRHSILDTQVEPIIKLPRQLGNIFIELIAEYAQSKGISVKQQSNLKGQLDATQDQVEFLKANFTKLIDHITNERNEKAGN